VREGLAPTKKKHRIVVTIFYIKIFFNIYLKENFKRFSMVDFKGLQEGLSEICLDYAADLICS